MGMVLSWAAAICHENGQLDVDRNSLPSLRPPLLLFSLSYGRIYDHRQRFVPRTDAMPDSLICDLNKLAMLSVVRDEATLDHLRSLGLTNVVLGGCPTLLLSQLHMRAPRQEPVTPPGQCSPSATRS